MSILEIYLLGFAIVYICTFLWGYFFEDREKNKFMWWTYQSFKIALASWLVIIIAIALAVNELDHYITRYLDK